MQAPSRPALSPLRIGLPQPGQIHPASVRSLRKAGSVSSTALPDGFGPRRRCRNGAYRLPRPAPRRAHRRRPVCLSGPGARRAAAPGGEADATPGKERGFGQEVSGRPFGGIVGGGDGPPRPPDRHAPGPAGPGRGAARPGADQPGRSLAPGGRAMRSEPRGRRGADRAGGHAEPPGDGRPPPPSVRDDPEPRRHRADPPARRRGHRSHGLRAGGAPRGAGHPRTAIPGRRQAAMRRSISCSACSRE